MARERTWLPSASGGRRSRYGRYPFQRILSAGAIGSRRGHRHASCGCRCGVESLRAVKRVRSSFSLPTHTVHLRASIMQVALRSSVHVVDLEALTKPHLVQLFQCLFANANILKAGARIIYWYRCESVRLCLDWGNPAVQDSALTKICGPFAYCWATAVLWKTPKASLASDSLWPRYRPNSYPPIRTLRFSSQRKAQIVTSICPSFYRAPKRRVHYYPPTRSNGRKQWNR